MSAACCAMVSSYAASSILYFSSRLTHALGSTAAAIVLPLPPFVQLSGLAEPEAGYEAEAEAAGCQTVLTWIQLAAGFVFPLLMLASTEASIYTAAAQHQHHQHQAPPPPQQQRPPKGQHWMESAQRWAAFSLGGPNSLLRGATGGTLLLMVLAASWDAVAMWCNHSHLSAARALLDCSRP